MNGHCFSAIFVFVYYWKALVVFIVCFSWSISLFAQGMMPDWKVAIPAQLNGKTPPRVFQTGRRWFTPITGGLLFFYQQVLSEQIQANCVYETTCSEYMKQCLQTYGVGRGILSGLYQYTTCTGFESRYHTPAEFNERRKIMNNTAHEIW